MNRVRVLLGVVVPLTLCLGCDLQLGFPRTQPTPSTTEKMQAHAALVLKNMRDNAVYVYIYTGPPRPLGLPCSEFKFAATLQHGAEHRVTPNAGQIAWAKVYFTAQTDGCLGADHSGPSVAGGPGYDVIDIISP